MKKTATIACVLAAASFVTPSAQARFVETADSAHIYRVLAENAPGRVKIPDVPRFTLVGKERMFYLGFGANLKMVGAFDWGHPIDDANNFTTSAIPMQIEPGNGGRTQMSVGQSNFYLNFVGLPGSANQVGIFLDINFAGSSYKTVALHQAYLKYRGITAGYVVSTFTDIGADPASIDFEGPNALTLVRHPNISYTQKFGRDRLWSAALGIDIPDRASFTDASAAQFVSQRMPDIPLYIQRSWHGGDSWLRASAVFRDLYYRDTAAGRNTGTLGWGVKISGKSTLCGPLSAMWQGVYGKGIAGYIQDIASLGLDLVPTQGDPSKLQTVKAWGAYGTLRYDFSKRVYADLTYSHVRAYAPRAVMAGDTYSYGQYVTGNVFWKINSFTQCGIEYLWGRRVDLNADQAHDNRIMLLLELSI